LRAFGANPPYGLAREKLCTVLDCPEHEPKFHEDIRQIVLKRLPRDPKFTLELAVKTPAELLIIFWNWQSRLVSAEPRRVYQAKPLLQRALATDTACQSALRAIISKLEDGIDVTPHLSRSIRHGFIPHKPSRKWRRPDLDLMLNDWGIHHLHLSMTLEEDGFTTRTGPLLFAMFRPGAAYLIDIIEHGGWTRDEVFKTVVDEWPDHGLFWELKGVTPPKEPLTEQQRKNLRNNRYSSYFCFGDKTYMPAGGLMTNGVSMRTTMRVQQFFRKLKFFTKQIEADPTCLATAATKFGAKLPVEPNLHFDFFSEGGYGIVDLKSGIQFDLTQ